MAAATLLPAGVLGHALGRARAALVREMARRRRTAADLAVADLRLRALSDRARDLADREADGAAELEATRRRLRRVGVELATSRAVLTATREELTRSRAERAAAVAALDGTRAALAVADAEAAAARRETEAVREQAAAARRETEAVREQAAAALAGLTTAAERSADPGETTAPPASRGQRSGASVDLRVFDAFLEAGLGPEDAALDAPVRRGRHAADPALGPEPATAVDATSHSAEGRVPSRPRRPGEARDRRDVA